MAESPALEEYPQTHVETDVNFGDVVTDNTPEAPTNPPLEFETLEHRDPMRIFPKQNRFSTYS